MNLVAVVFLLVLLARCPYYRSSTNYLMSSVPPTTPASSAPTVLDPTTFIKMVVNLAVVIKIIVHLVAVVFLLGLMASACTCVLSRYIVPLVCLCTVRSSRFVPFTRLGELLMPTGALPPTVPSLPE